MYEKKDDIFPKKAVKKIPAKDVRQADSHIKWIEDREERLENGAEKIVFILTNAIGIEENARSISANIYYVHYEEFLSWSHKSIGIVRDLREKFNRIGAFLLGEILSFEHKRAPLV